MRPFLALSFSLKMSARRRVVRGTEMQSAALAFSGSWFLSTKWCRTVQIEGFSRTTAPGRLGKISICAVLQHFVNRNQEEFKGGPRCRRDGLESRRGV